MPDPTPVTSIATAIGKLADAFTEWTKSLNSRQIVKEKEKYRTACDIADKAFEAIKENSSLNKDAVLKKRIRQFYDVLT